MFAELGITLCHQLSRKWCIKNKKFSERKACCSPVTNWVINPASFLVVSGLLLSHYPQSSFTYTMFMMFLFRAISSWRLYNGLKYGRRCAVLSYSVVTRAALWRHRRRQTLRLRMEIWLGSEVRAHNAIPGRNAQTFSLSVTFQMAVVLQDELSAVCCDLFPCRFSIC